VPMTHGRRFQSLPRNATPGNRRVRSASSARDSTTAPFVRRVRLASSVTSWSVMSDRRMLKGVAFAMQPGYHSNYSVSSVRARRSDAKRNCGRIGNRGRTADATARLEIGEQRVYAERGCPERVSLPRAHRPRRSPHSGYRRPRRGLDRHRILHERAGRVGTDDRCAPRCLDRRDCGERRVIRERFPGSRKPDDDTSPRTPTT
jgi:hypothetical protein